VVDDQFGSPTYAGDLARALAQLMAEGRTGVFHLTNAGSCSWHEFTREILRQAGFGATRVAPITSHELNRAARRPAYSVLANTAWHAAGHPPLRPWSDALAAMLEAWRAAGPSAEPRFPQSPQ
jgi:dTDP-4-dehydrorhamnose reductase